MKQHKKHRQKLKCILSFFFPLAVLLFSEVYPLSPDPLQFLGKQKHEK